MGFITEVSLIANHSVISIAGSKECIGIKWESPKVHTMKVNISIEGAEKHTYMRVKCPQMP